MLALISFMRILVLRRQGHVLCPSLRSGQKRTWTVKKLGSTWEAAWSDSVRFHASQIVRLLWCFQGVADVLRPLAASCCEAISCVQSGAERIRQHQHRRALRSLHVDMNDATVVGFDIRHFDSPHASCPDFVPVMRDFVVGRKTWMPEVRA